MKKPTPHTTRRLLASGIPRSTIAAYELATGISLGETDPWPVGAYGGVIELERIARVLPLDTTIGQLADAFLAYRVDRLANLRVRA